MSKIFNKYNDSKIYKITSLQSEKFYIGSTIQTLENRFYHHLLSYKKYLINNNSYISSFDILKYGDAVIELIENVNCNNRKELGLFENKYLKLYRDKCVNKFLTGRTRKEYCNDLKTYFRNYQKNYYQNNKIFYKNYYQKNKERIKAYYEANKEYYQKYNRERKIYIKQIKKEKMINNENEIKIATTTDDDNFKLIII